MASVDTASSSPRARVLIVDDMAANREVLERLLQSDGYATRSVADGETALASLEREPADLVLLDVVMPRLDGYTVCRRIKSQPATRLVPVVLVTSLHGIEDRIEGINAGADDFLTKPYNAHELRARVRSLIKLKRFTDDLESAEAVVLGLAMTIEARDAYTNGHCQRLARYATEFGRRLGLLETELAALHRGGYLHDIGKIAIPDAILLKQGPLAPEEYERIKEHPVIGERLCSPMRSLRAVCPIVRHHHERYDGSGYPDGLAGDDIPLLAQVLGIVDVFDALTTDRPYRRPLSSTEALRELGEEAARRWRNADLIDRFIRLATERRFISVAGVPVDPLPS